MRLVVFRMLALAVLAPATASAANPWESGGSLETCVEAVLKERPGVITGWRQSGGGDAPPYVVSVLSQDGTNAEVFCDPAKPGNLEFKNKMGLFRYSMYQRATFPEAKARESAPEIFAGPARVTAMELTVGVSGKPTYKYQMFLPSNHKATVKIDAITGRLNEAQID